MSQNEFRKDLRNLAIVAHVDHGKTTLVDGLLKICGAFQEHRVVEDRVLDSGDLERERGITILSKCTSVEYQGVRIQLVDTPGHADFGGEVERVLGMVDSVLLLVDAVEGVMPQTRFVLRKALEHGLLPILVVNKIDRPEQRGEAVLDEVFDLLVELGANDTQLDFPVVYASAKHGKATRELGGAMGDLRPVLDTILEFAPSPCVDLDGPLQFQAVTLGYDSFVGRLVIGRVECGELVRGDPVVRVPREGAPEAFRITKLFGTAGIDRIDLERASAGDIIMLAGIDSIEIGDTICQPDSPVALPRIEIDPPTIKVNFLVNTSPFAGREGRFVTSRQIGERLEREVLGNVSIHIADTGRQDAFEVAGRGELQLGVLIETMRREGYEFAVSRPEIILREIDGVRCEPVETVVIDVPEVSAGSVMEKLAERKGRMETLEHMGVRIRLEFVVPSRCLFGYRTAFLTDTRGEGVLYRAFRGYEPHAGDLDRRGVGGIVATDQGRTTPHAIFKIQERAALFVPPGEEVYEGQVVGEARRPGDLNVNVCRAKKLDNMRAAGKDDSPLITPHRKLTIESALEWIEPDELLEVTPASLRLRKQILAGNLRKR
ncbi:MAG: translational GTPase TypA [Myxococcota bacterium]|jgi:GTP-binding protein|nr:translational GTPase TypA [Deltaproteobacteria bacterium]MCP4243852.1 translational GTPase TypA [bacterium]MDP6073546.1 translational GTPase TypA [Myxococcota bacterium]MBT39845.1 translational GTPase TypA [Deltaproteobacteria bacterium]MDP7073217.1 translational GTPase TypA [Myxococcota bacterium]